MPKDEPRFCKSSREKYLQQDLPKPFPFAKELSIAASVWRYSGCRCFLLLSEIVYLYGKDRYAIVSRFVMDSD